MPSSTSTANNPHVDQALVPVGSRDAHDSAVQVGKFGLSTAATDSKRARACEACRSLKIRCLPDEQNPGAPCRRCRGAKRQCLIIESNRKRQRKADIRVADLERKIDVLTAAMQISSLKVL